MRPRVGWPIVLALALVCGMASAAGASVAAKPTNAEQTLINKHVPAGAKSTCVGNTATFKKKPPAELKPYVKNLLASVNCPVSGQGLPGAITYQQYANLKSMAAFYDFNLAVSNIQVGSNPNATTCPKEVGYSIGSSKTLAGYYGCAPATATEPTLLFWTNNRLKILSVTAATNDPQGTLLLNFFHTGAAGPKG